MPFLMPPAITRPGETILDPANVTGAKVLSPDAGAWDKSGSLWVPGVPTSTAYSLKISNELLSDSGFSLGWRAFLSPWSIGLDTTAPTPVADLPVTERDMPVIGYRAWTLTDNFKLGVGRRPRLKSTGMDYSWRAGINTATCQRRGQHDAPDQRCDCGLYVLASLKELDKHVSFTNSLIVGAVVGWGRVIQHGTEGWRAQHAKIIGLLDCKFSEKQLERTGWVAAAYRLEVKTRTQLEALVREYGDPVK